MNQIRDVFNRIKNPATIRLVVEICFMLFLLFIAFRVYEKNKKEIGPRRDIAVEFTTGIELKEGVNPYVKVKEYGYDLLRNRKYNEKLPAYYFFLLAIAWISKFDFETYITIFRYWIYSAAFIAAIFTYLAFRDKNQKIMGFTAAAFLLFNRWTLLNIKDVKSDMLAIAFLLAALYFLNKKPKLSFLLYGLSLGMKHVAIFVFPVFLLPFLHKQIKLNKYIENVSYSLIPTLLPSIIFIIQDIKSFALSLLFSVTRSPSSTNSSVPFGYDQILIKFNPTGIGFLTPFFYMLPRLPLILFTSLLVFLLVTKRIRPSLFVFGCFLVFGTFNPVVLDQYFTWVSSFALYAAVDYLGDKRQV